MGINWILCAFLIGWMSAVAFADYAKGKEYDRLEAESRLWSFETGPNKFKQIVADELKKGGRD